MVRTVLSLTLVAAFGGLLPAAPIPPGAQRARPSFPTRVGTKWVYLYPEGEECTKEITESKTEKGVTHVTVKCRERDGRICVWEKLAVSDEGLFLLEDVVSTFAPPVPWIKGNPKAGQKWTFDSSRQLNGAVGAWVHRGTITCVGPEKVKVAAGEFDAFRLEGKGTFGWKETRWYAPGVGMVKWLRRENEIITLKSFTPGKE